MIAPSQNIYHFNITLLDIKPVVWRCIQVPQDYSFWDLHVAIQDAMGWQDKHLHEWLVEAPKTGQQIHLGIYPAEFEDEPEVIMDWEVPIKKFFKKEEVSIPYNYDFGDDWRHEILLAEILPRELDKTYPRCICGMRACPPEDVGETGGYEDFLEAIKDPNNEQHKTMLEWVGSDFDPEKFDSGKVKFDDPKKRWDYAFHEEI